LYAKARAAQAIRDKDSELGHV